MTTLRLDPQRIIGLGTIATAFVVAQVLVWVEDHVAMLIRRFGPPDR